MSDSDSSPQDDEEKFLLEARVKALETDLRQKKEIILAQHVKLEAILESSIDALVQMDFDGHITGWNKQAEAIFGWCADEIVDRRIDETIIPVRYRAAHAAGMKRYLDTGRTSVMNNVIEIHALHKEGHEFPVEISVSVVDNPDLQEFNAYIRDISDRKHAETVIWNQSNFDALTNLPNSNMFLQKLDHETSRCDRSNQSMALIYLDVDRFKDVNDSLGHKYADRLLVEISRRLKKTVREVDTVSRLNGDQFAIILGNISDQLSVQPICQELLDKLSRPYRIDAEKVFLTGSIGVTFYPQDSKKIETLQRNAERAMYAAKAEGSNRYNFFTPELQQRALRKRRLVKDLRDAIRRQQLELYFQPIIDLGDNRIAKAESLLRWQHPEFGLVKPALFIPIAEETGMMSELGDWIFHQAIERAERWRRQYDTSFQVSINTSPRQWTDESAPMSKWFEHMRQSGISGDALMVEITEGLLVDAGDRITNRLLDFREEKIQISIDDFGTGYTSLPNLRQFDIDYLKIDHSYVRHLDSDEDDFALCEAVIVMAHKLGLRVIAEGVENENQHRLLKRFGCDFGQGNYYSKPVTAKEFEQQLRNRHPDQAAS